MADATQSEPPAAAGRERGRMSARLLVGPYRVLRGNRPLALLATGYACSSLGVWLTLISLSILAYSLSHAAATVALVTFVVMAPPALFAPLVGMLIDRVEPRRLLVGASAGCALCMLGLTAVHSPSTLWLAFPLAGAASTLAAVIRPSMSTAVPDMVAEEAIEDANGMQSQIEVVTNVVAPILSSLLFLTGHASVAFIVAALSYAGAAMAYRRVRVVRRRDSARPDDAGPLGNLLVGFRFLFRENGHALSALALAETGIGLANGAWFTLIVVLCATSFHLGARSAGFLDASWALGGVVGGFIIAWTPSIPRFGGLFMLGMAASSASTVLFGLSPAGLAPFAIVIIMGIADVAVQVNRASVLQAATPNELLGRVFSAFEAVQVLATVLGIALAGFLVATAGPRGATVIFGLLSLAALLLALPRLLRLEQAIGVRIFLRQVPILATLSRRALDELGGRLHSESYPDGAVIVYEGERGDRLYMVQDGTVEVSAQGNRPTPVTMATLRKLDYFGEIALLHDVARTATVRARGLVRLYSLNRADFTELIGRATHMEQSMAATADARAAETRSRTIEPDPAPDHRAK